MENKSTYTDMEQDDRTGIQTIEKIILKSVFMGPLEKEMKPENTYHYTVKSLTGCSFKVMDFDR